jgi:hypothetical protein
MASQLVVNNYNSTSSVQIPDNATNVKIYIRGASGGIGGTDGGNIGGGFGYSRSGTFQYKTNFVSRNITAVIGTVGNNGANNVTGGGGGAGGSSILAAGGRGGNAGGGRGYSGGGGGGGGASAILNSSGNAILVAGGGGGGGGGSWERNGIKGNDAGSWISSVSTVSSGGTGGDVGFDGGGGGGGGGGSPGGGGGGAGADQSVGGGAGGGGGCAYSSDVFDVVNFGQLDSGNGGISILYDLWTPTINSFDISPDPQNSSGGVPSSTVTISWSVSNANSITITDLGTVNSSGSATINTGLQSVVGSNSPATKIYTLTACAGSVCDTATVTAQVYNDNTPSIFKIPDQLNKNPNTELTISNLQITEIDMPTFVICGPGVTVETISGSYTTQRLVNNSQSLSFKVTTEPFNTDENGLVNEKNCYVTIGTVTYNFLVQTRAPNVLELFDFGDNQFSVPYPKIDTTDFTPSPYLKSPTIIEESLNDWEIELENPYGVQIKSNNSNLQVNVKRQGDLNFDDTNWQTPNSI